MRPDAAGLKTAVEAVDGFCRAAGVPKAIAWRLQVALDEVLSNAGRHGDVLLPVEVTPRVDNDVVSLTIADDGPAFDPLADRPGAPTSGPLETRPVGGLGLVLLKKLVDEVSYRRDGQRNVLVITCRLRGTSPTAC